MNDDFFASLAQKVAIKNNKKIIILWWELTGRDACKHIHVLTLDKYSSSSYIITWVVITYESDHTHSFWS